MGIDAIVDLRDERSGEGIETIRPCGRGEIFPTESDIAKMPSEKSAARMLLMRKKFIWNHAETESGHSG